jgi:D-alanine-D-alanine ligase
LVSEGAFHAVAARVNRRSLGGKSKRGYNKVRATIAKRRIGLLNKKRGNFAIQEKLIGADNVVDETDAEVEHHEQALTEAGYSVYQIHWGPNFINDLPSPFCVARSGQDCEVFRDDPPFEYPLFIKPVAGRGSAGINDASVVHNYDQLVTGSADC